MPCLIGKEVRPGLHPLELVAEAEERLGLQGIIEGDAGAHGGMRAKPTEGMDITIRGCADGPLAQSGDSSWACSAPRGLATGRP